MKRIIAFITALGMCATTLVGNTALFSPTAYAVTEENAIDLFVENYSMWNELPLLTGGYGAVSFLDIDFDGNLELVAGYMGGSGLFTSLEFYKIDGDNVIKLSAEDDYADYPDIMGNGMSLYRNDQGELAYYGYDSLRSGVFYNSSTFCSFVYNPSSNYVERKNYSLLFNITRSTTENVAILRIFRRLTFHLIVFNRESKHHRTLRNYLSHDPCSTAPVIISASQC